MKLTLLQEHLNKALTHASRIVATKAQMPVLSHIKLDATPQDLIISATDLEIGLRLHVTAKVDEPGSLTLPARVITELIGNCGPGNLQLETRNLELVITGSGTKATVSGMSAEEFPTLPEFTGQPLTELPVDQLLQAVTKVGFAAATDDTRPILTAIQLKQTDGGLELAATDGFRLSWLSLPFPDLTRNAKRETRNASWLIPARSLQEVSRLITPGLTTVGFTVTDKHTQVIFKLGDTELISRLVSGDFPDFHKIMPDNGDTTVEMSRADLLRAIRLAAIFARESANIVKLSIQSNQVLITANAPQVGGQESTVDAKVTGPAAEIAFNYRYVLDLLAAGDSPSIQLLMTTSLGPGLWLEMPSSTSNEKRETRNAEMQYKHVIMPVRLENSTQ